MGLPTTTGHNCRLTWVFKPGCIYFADNYYNHNGYAGEELSGTGLNPQVILANIIVDTTSLEPELNDLLTAKNQVIVEKNQTAALP